jgi:hypothetical protein
VPALLLLPRLLLLPPLPLKWRVVHVQGDK